MKRSILLVALLAFVLAGCAKDYGGLGRGWNPTKPKVDIINGSITPDQEVLVFPKGVSGPITWTLSDPKFEFADKGIEIDGALTDKVIRGEQTSVVLDTRQGEIVECVRSGDGAQFTCNNKHTKPGVYKYTIRVRERGNPNAKPIERDPQVVNM